MKATHLLFPAAALALSSCLVGPDYHKPDLSTITPARWKWRNAEPRDNAPKCSWWTVFGDAELNRLESKAVASNTGARAALARFDQARAYTRASSAAFIPSLQTNPAVSRQMTSGKQPTPIPFDIPQAQLNTFSVPFELSYEVDLWGRIRRTVESAEADTQATASAYHNVLLSVTSEVATCYFQMRACDAEINALEQTTATRRKSLQLIEQRAKAGATNEIDASRARAELASTAVEIADVKRQREELVCAISLLCGQPASSFHIANHPLGNPPPRIPAGIPAHMLERRPDIASAERNVAARNADIGIATAGYFPSLNLTSQAGYLSKDTASLFTADSRVWTLGAGISQPVTGFFTTKAKIERARAARDEAIETYRGTVLSAVKDVETALARIHYRELQTNAQAKALESSRRANDLIRANYEAGSITYLELLESDRTCIAQQRALARLQATRLTDSVSLIRALGGAW